MKLRTSSVGVTLVELLVAMAVFVFIMVIIGFFMAQQSRVVALSQSVNEAEITARTIAEAIAQDFQMAGSRAVYVGGQVNYDDLYDKRLDTCEFDADFDCPVGNIDDFRGCREQDRHTCVTAIEVDADGNISAPGTITGYSILYRTSLDDTAPNCRRIDVAFVQDTGSLYRSDVECDFDMSQINLAATLFATGVQDFSVVFQCSDAAASADPIVDPAVCYSHSAASFVRQATVTVTAQVEGRLDTTGTMSLVALTPNLRPSVVYVEP